MPFTFSEDTDGVLPITVMTPAHWETVASELSANQRSMAERLGFRPKPGRSCLVPGDGAEGGLVLFCVEDATSRAYNPLLPGQLAASLPQGVYKFAADTPDLALAVLSWALSSYRFTRYKGAAGERPNLCASENVDSARVLRIVEGIALGRDLINTPANDLGPDALEAAAVALGERHGAALTVIRGRDLETGFPLIHAVGLAAHQPPRLVELVWGDPEAPKVTLVGKGVTFDTGGLNIKPDSSMLLMKKDMGGAAVALALASMVMDAGLKLRLRVLVPIVENAISAAAFRPGDIYRSRKGLTVEIGNTDAEGRLILADALTFASEDRPDLILDFATLTGAARVALGPDLPPVFTDDDILAGDIASHAKATCDPVWRLPLWQPYESMLDGKISDLNNVGGSPFAGSITAALFLRRFVEPDLSWAHFDVFGWAPAAKPGRPEGGEVQTARLLYDLLSARYPA